MNPYRLNYNEKLDRHEVINCNTQLIMFFSAYREDALEYMYNLAVHDE